MLGLQNDTIIVGSISTFLTLCDSQVNLNFKNAVIKIFRETFTVTFYIFLTCQESFERGWRDSSAVKKTDCSPEDPEFKSQQPHGGSQPSAIESDALFWCV